MPRKRKWRPRASSMGYYLQCDLRALLDKRAHDTGTSAPRTSSPEADFGTVVHFMLQRLAECQFPEGAEPPSEAVQANAAKLKGGSIDAMAVEAKATAMRALPELNVLDPDGVGWLAEVEVVTEHYSGHIDFLRLDRRVIVDLKTTGKRPRNHRIKPDHVGQFLSYALAVPEVELVYGLYAGTDSPWIEVPPPIEIHSAAMAPLLERIKAYIAFLASYRLEKRATPRFGAHCWDNWCPHTAICRDLVFPPDRSGCTAIKMTDPTKWMV